MCCCTQRINRNSSNKNVSIVSIENNEVSIISLDKGMHDLRIESDGKSLFNGTYSETWKSSVIEILTGKGGSLYDIAYKATMNIKSGININIKIDNDKDTTIYVPLEPKNIQTNKSTIVGKCAKLISLFSDPEQKVRLKKWLFRRNERLDDYRINKMIGIMNLLSYNGFSDYITNDDIPIIRSFAGEIYKIESDITADHYVLYAASSEEDLKSFVEEIIANDFELTAQSLEKPLNCYRAGESNGYKCITLICINKDWSYKVIPLGIIGIDNSSPSQTEADYIANDAAFIILKDNQRVILPSKKKDIYGYANVIELGSEGNGVSCNVTFQIEFGGDVKSVTIVREIYAADRDWCGLRPERKTILVAGKRSPYIFTYPLHLVDGDNIVPIEVEDYLGNRNQYSINIPAEFVRKSSSDINIDNNINVWDN